MAANTLNTNDKWQVDIEEGGEKVKAYAGGKSSAIGIDRGQGLFYILLLIAKRMLIAEVNGF